MKFTCGSLEKKTASGEQRPTLWTLQDGTGASVLGNVAAVIRQYD